MSAAGRNYKAEAMKPDIFIVFEDEEWPIVAGVFTDLKKAKDFKRLLKSRSINHWAWDKKEGDMSLKTSRSKTKVYTVVGLYRDNNQVYVTFVKAFDIHNAVHKAKTEMSLNGGGGAALAVFSGKRRDLYGEDEIIED
jgi:hypothetical protein